MIEDFTIFRETFQCSNCYSQPRVRFLKYILDTYFSDYTIKLLHESSPVDNSFLKKVAKNYSYSYYNPSETIGLNKNKIQNINLEDLSCFFDETFDYFITQDVMEHVYNPDLAFREIQRVLKKGGSHIFTVPTFTNQENFQTKARVKQINNIIEYLDNPVYHKNPDGSPSLVTIDYGVDILEVIQQWTGSIPKCYKYKFIEYVPLEVYTLTK